MTKKPLKNFHTSLIFKELLLIKRNRGTEGGRKGGRKRGKEKGGRNLLESGQKIQRGNSQKKF